MNSCKSYYLTVPSFPTLLSFFIFLLYLVYLLEVRCPISLLTFHLCLFTFHFFYLHPLLQWATGLNIYFLVQIFITILHRLISLAVSEHFRNVARLTLNQTNLFYTQYLRYGTIPRYSARGTEVCSAHNGIPFHCHCILLTNFPPYVIVLL